MKKPEKVQAVLTLTISYDVNETSEDEIRSHLKRMVDHIASMGSFTSGLDDSGTLVDDWDVEVKTKVIK
jgi:hypothetical protein